MPASQAPTAKGLDERERERERERENVSAQKKKSTNSCKKGEEKYLGPRRTDGVDTGELLRR